MSALEEALAALWVARRQLSAQMDQIDKAIDALRVLDGNEPVATSKVRTAVAGKTKATTKRKGLTGLPAVSFECDTCGLAFKSIGGVAVHRARIHGAKKWASRSKDAIEPPADEAERFADAVEAASKNPRKALFCDSCDFTVPSLHAEAINKHTLAEHQRIASRTERVPKAV